MDLEADARWLFCGLGQAGFLEWLRLISGLFRPTPLPLPASQLRIASSIIVFVSIMPQMLMLQDLAGASPSPEVSKLLHCLASLQIVKTWVNNLKKHLSKCRGCTTIGEQGSAVGIFSHQGFNQLRTGATFARHLLCKLLAARQILPKFGLCGFLTHQSPLGGQFVNKLRLHLLEPSTSPV